MTEEDISRAKKDIADIDERFDRATGWGSWMSSASKRRHSLVERLRTAGHHVEHRHEIVVGAARRRMVS